MGKLVAFVTQPAISFTSPFVFLLLCSFALFSCHVQLLKTSCLSVQCSERVARLTFLLCRKGKTAVGRLRGFWMAVSRNYCS